MNTMRTWRKRALYQRLTTILILAVAVLVLASWCWFLATNEVGACNGIRVSSWNNGGYTSLCVEQ